MVGGPHDQRARARRRHRAHRAEGDGSADGARRARRRGGQPRGAARRGVARRGGRRRGADAEHHQAAQGARRQPARAVLHRDHLEARLPADRAGRQAGGRGDRPAPRRRRRLGRGGGAILALVAAILYSLPTPSDRRRRRRRRPSRRQPDLVTVTVLPFETRGRGRRAGLPGARHRRRPDDRPVAPFRPAADHAAPPIRRRRARYLVSGSVQREGASAADQRPAGRGAQRRAALVGALRAAVRRPVRGPGRDQPQPRRAAAGQDQRRRAAAAGQAVHREPRGVRPLPARPGAVPGAPRARTTRRPARCIARRSSSTRSSRAPTPASR